MESESIFSAFAEFNLDSAKQPVISVCASEKFVAPSSSRIPTATAKPQCAKSLTVLLNTEKPSNETVLPSDNERRFLSSSPDELLEKQLNRNSRASLDRQIELLGVANTYFARGMDARLIPQGSDLSTVKQPGVLDCILWVGVATVVIWFAVHWYYQSSVVGEPTFESRVADEDVITRASNSHSEPVARYRRRRVPVRRHPIIAESVANELYLQPALPQVFYAVTLGGSEKDSKESTGRLPSHTVSNPENSTLPRRNLPSRLTFGLQLELALTEAASSLGGPVAAITTAEIRDPDSDLLIPSGTVVQFETAQYSNSGRVAIDWSKPARLLLADDKTISLRGYIVAEDGSVDLPAAPFGHECGSGEYKRLAQSFLAMGGKYARRRSTIVGDLVSSVYREISEPTYQWDETPILVTPSGTRFSLTLQ